MNATAGHTAKHQDSGSGEVSQRISTLRLNRLASQFAILSMAEVICRIISLLVVIELVRRVGREGYGRIEFCFNLVYWLIFVIRDGIELVFYREISRRPRPNPRLINAFLSLKLMTALALWLFVIMAAFVIFRSQNDRLLLCSYGSLLIPTAIGLDNVFRSREKPAIVAISLVIRTALYATGVLFCIHDASRLYWIPWLFLSAELLGISLVWFRYSQEFGLPKFRFRHARRFGAPVLAQGRSVLGIQFIQVMLATLDIMIIGLMDEWADVGLYSAPQRMIAAAITFSIIFQQVLMPHLVRSFTRDRNAVPASIRRIVILAMAAILPPTIFVTLYSKSLINFLFTSDFNSAWPLLAVGIWRVPVLCVSSIHITTLLATHREREGLRILARCLLIAIPMVIIMHSWRGLIGTSCAMLMMAVILAVCTADAIHNKSICLANSGQTNRNLPRRFRVSAAGGTIVSIFCLMTLSLLFVPKTAIPEQQSTPIATITRHEKPGKERRILQQSSAPQSEGRILR